MPGQHLGVGVPITQNMSYNWLISSGPRNIENGFLVRISTMMHLLEYIGPIQLDTRLACEVLTLHSTCLLQVRKLWRRVEVRVAGILAYRP